MSCFSSSLSNATSAFNLLITCYIYGCLIYVFLLFVGQTYLTLSKRDRLTEPLNHLTNAPTQPELSLVDDLNQSETSKVSNCCFDSLSIRELRTYVKDNQLHELVRDRLSKTVSNARKYELVACLKSI